MSVKGGFQTVTGLTCYVLIRSPNDGQTIWNGSSLEAYLDANYLTYVVVATEQGVSGFYEYVFPTDLTQGSYDVVAKYKVGVDPSVTDDGDVTSGEVVWSGTTISPTITPSAPGFTTAYTVCYDENGVVQEDIKVSMHAVPGAANTGIAHTTVPIVVTSGIDGVAEFPNRIKGVSYKLWRGTTGGITVKIPLTADSTYAMPYLVGE